jgi:hypothetical protein
MKLIPLTIIAAGIAALLLTAGCGKSLQQRIDQAKGSVAEEQRAVERAHDDAESEYLDEWQTFRGEAEKQIAANAKTMDDLKAKMATANDQLKSKVASDMVSLEKKNAELKKKLDSYKDEGKVNWDAFKRDFSQDLEGLSKSLNDLGKTDKK